MKQVERLEKGRLRPYVIFNLETRSKAVHALIRNDGASFAKNIRVSIKPELQTTLGIPDRKCVFIEKPVNFLAGGQEISDLLGSGPEFDKKYKDVVFKGTISYSDAAGTKYKEPFEISLWHILNRYHTSTDAEDLKKIAEKGLEALEKIADR